MIYLALTLGFVFLTLGAHWLVDGGSSLGKRFNIPDIVIGLTIVSIGTSAPELVVSLIASIKGSTDLAITNVIGSNIFNTLLIIGLAAVFYPIAVNRNTLRWELPLSMLASVLLILFAWDIIPTGGRPQAIVRLDGMIFLVFFCAFLYYNYFTARKTNRTDGDDIKIMGPVKSVLFILLGIGFLYAGGRAVVYGAVEVARQLGVSEKTIGLTIVAIATSLPEVITSAVAAIKKNSDIAIGNALGSNIFNIWFVLGISALVHPLPVNNNLLPDTGVSVLSNVLIFFLIVASPRGTRSIGRFQGLFLILVYLAYMYYVLANR